MYAVPLRHYRVVFSSNIKDKKRIVSIAHSRKHQKKIVVKAIKPHLVLIKHSRTEYRTCKELLSSVAMLKLK